VKDFVEMIIHHITTITLMAMSWSANMIRAGTLVLCLHDAVDYMLEVCSPLVLSVSVYSHSLPCSTYALYSV